MTIIRSKVLHLVMFTKVPELSPLKLHYMYAMNRDGEVTWLYDLGQFVGYTVPTIELDNTRLYEYDIIPLSKEE